MLRVPVLESESCLQSDQQLPLYGIVNDCFRSQSAKRIAPRNSEHHKAGEESKHERIILESFSRCMHQHSQIPSPAPKNLYNQRISTICSIPIQVEFDGYGMEPNSLRINWTNPGWYMYVLCTIIASSTAALGNVIQRSEPKLPSAWVVVLIAVVYSDIYFYSTRSFNANNFHKRSVTSESGAPILVL